MARADDQRARYDHEKNLHTVEGASAVLEYIVEMVRDKSVLDVGAGTGSWMRAAMLAGASDVTGVDGVPADDRHIEVDPDQILTADLEQPLELGRKFELAFCVEVAEHLHKAAAPVLVESICRHSDAIIFSAACPGQSGQGHINCQWPAYWQRLFSKNGFVCDDRLRFRIWNDSRIEPWYRQNLFIARKGQTADEREILNLIHPEMVPHLSNPTSHVAIAYKAMKEGRISPRNYLRPLWKSVGRRIGFSRND